MAIISNKPLGYLVVCRLIAGRDYAGLLKGLARFHHKQLLDGVWMVRTKDSATEIYRHVYRRVDPEDQILIFEITDQGLWSSTLPAETQVWVKDVLSSIAPCAYQSGGDNAA